MKSNENGLIEHSRSKSKQKATILARKQQQQRQPSALIGFAKISATFLIFFFPP